jgi:nucleotide-binding universal stress UspA family protein
MLRKSAAGCGANMAHPILQETRMSHAPRQILVHLDPTESAGPRFKLARRLAEAFDARLASLYAVTPTLVALPYPADFAVAADLVRFDGERRERAAHAYQEALRGPGPQASWASTEAVPIAGAFARQALHADLLVLGQPDPDDPASVTVPPGFIADVLSASGRPALVVPYIGVEGVPFQSIAIAWKESREAARAVTAALPFLQRARSVHVLTWGPLGDGVEGEALDLKAYLAAHGVRAEWHAEPDEPAQVGAILLSRVADLGADLLVMGCYGHARLREWVLGGASRTVLDSMTVPVLMSH